jgi:hypothetical protein
MAAEDHYGRGVGAVAAGRLADGRLFVWAATAPTRAAIAAWLAMLAGERKGSTLILGPSLDGDAVFGPLPVLSRRTASATMTKAGLAGIRTLVGTRTLAHDGGEALTGQMTAARVVETDGGGLLLSGGHARSDLVRAAAWVVADLSRPPDTPRRFVIR